MAGGIDSFGNIHQPSESITEASLAEADPDLLFIALCGFDEQRTRQDLSLLPQRIKNWSSLRCVRQENLFYTDGNAYFSRPGPRLVDSLEIMAHCLHPQLHPLPEYLRPALNFCDLI